MRKNLVERDMARMYKELTDPEEQEEARQRAQVKQDAENKRIDTGL